MKRSTFLLLFFIFAGMVATFFFVFIKKDNTSAPVPLQAYATQEAETSFDKALFLHVLQGEEVVEMSLHEYLIGVVSAEMPATFPSEALKAQAIAARTFTLRQSEMQKHPNADICTRSDCCQGWQAKKNASATQAVEETDGLVITYDDALIEATYFSCCGSRTESALAVWGADIPYLQSVESHGESDAPRYKDEVVIDASFFTETLRAQYPQMDFSGSAEDWIGKISYTKGGGIDSATIGGVCVTGIELRKLFSLRSTDICFEVSEDRIIMTTYGFGHRVGMSQYGAKAMAENACDFQDILTYYYQNVQLQRLYMEKTEL